MSRRQHGNFCKLYYPLCVYKTKKENVTILFATLHAEWTEDR